MMALVVAMAGMMLPAISLTTKRDCGGMPKMQLRRFAAAVTKSRHSQSSLSNASWPAFSPRASNARTTAPTNAAAFSATLHTAWSSSGEATGRPARSGTSSANESGSGGRRSFQRVLIASRRRTSAAKTASKMRAANSRAPSPGCSSSLGAGAPSPAVAAAAGAVPSSAAAGAPSSELSTRSVSSPEKTFLKSSSLAHAMQCTGLSGWLRTVQIG
mmetsp:Transcript_6473/g.15622  ORF Transcript_6473/g.15622 Transcript_6473/m.15622 type:complete len:215 (+) Transcript_6473:842-1486(+)